MLDPNPLLAHPDAMPGRPAPAVRRAHVCAMDKNRQPSKRVSLAGMHIDRTSSVPLPLQIAAHIWSCILRGILPAGTQSLGSREIARELGCSRTVVLTAWDLHYAEGYLESTPRGSVMVASVATPHVRLPSAASSDRSSPAAEPAHMSERWRSLLAFDDETNSPSEFSPGAPDISSFPFEDWSRLLRQAWQDPREQECLDLPPEGHASTAAQRDRELPRFGSRARLLSGRGGGHFRHVGRL
jgi:GntR family transcriptional regulator / MocR family aminotransferase